jgi:hypothetical protein
MHDAKGQGRPQLELVRHSVTSGPTEEEVNAARIIAAMQDATPEQLLMLRRVAEALVYPAAVSA